MDSQQWQLAVGRHRRIIYNNDGGDARAPREKRTMANFLESRTTPLIGSQVDTIIYDTTAATFGRFSHRTEVAEMFLVQEGVYQHNFTPELINRHGTDPLQVMIDFAREHDFEIFWSMRMNDTHDAGNPLALPELKKNHPEIMCGASSERPQKGAWTAVDYAQPLVRDLAYRFIEEVALNYDVDGILMDFFRHPVFFKKAAWGEPIGQEELDQMTSVVRRVRARTKEISADRGKPILLAVRTPDCLEYNRAIGIDLERWMAEGLVDLFIPGGYFRLNRWQASVELGHRYGVRVYPSFDETRVGGGMYADEDRNSLESYRARAMNAWHAGADGIHLFNMFEPHHPMLREIGSPQTLVGLDKVYFTGVRGNWRSANPERFLNHTDSFFDYTVITPDSPLELANQTTIDLDVGEDIGSAVDQGMKPVITLRLIFEKEAEQRQPSVSWNGYELQKRQNDGECVDYIIEPEWLKKGSNRLELTPSHPNTTLCDVQVWVTYP